jgi:hypothetical protein
LGVVVDLGLFWATKAGVLGLVGGYSKSWFACLIAINWTDFIIA